ncbi:MAG TPA: hypothetical protein VIU15_40880 [Streptomyces sp.]
MTGDVQNSIKGGEFQAPVVQGRDIGSVVIHPPSPPHRVRRRHLALGAAFLTALTLTGVYLLRGDGESPLTASVETTDWKCPDSAVVPGLRLGAGGMKPMRDFPKDGVRASGTFKAGLQSKGDQEFLLTGARVQIVARRPPVHGTHVQNPCGSEVPRRVFDLDLDRPTPQLVPAKVTDDRPDEEGVENVTDWPYQVKGGDPEYLVIRPKSQRYDTEFRVLLDWTREGHKGVLVLDDHGKPFRVTATASADPTCVTVRQDLPGMPYWVVPANSPLCPKT